MRAAAYAANGQPVSRAAFLAMACDPRRSVAVQACAGAGKTWMLVSRMLRALLEGTAPHEILAITFTRKAAAEMRQRLHEWLVKFSDPATPRRELAEQLRMRGIEAVDDAGIEALRRVYPELLDATRGADIQTFHGWFAQLLGAAPLATLQALGLPVDFELLQDDADAVRQVWRRYLARVLGDAALKADYQASVAAHGRSNTAKALEAALARRVEFALADDGSRIEASVQPMAQAFPEFAGGEQPDSLLDDRRVATTLADAVLPLGQGGATQRRQGALLQQALADQDLAAVLRALLTQDKQQPRKLGDAAAVLAAQALCLRLLEAGRQHEAWLHQQRMTRLARALIEEFAVLKRERGWVDMGDLERAAEHLLGDDALSGWVLQRLDARYRQVLIDEFQDTNPKQWQTLRHWLAGYAGAGGGARPAVFIVGDPKQSIYRFRRAEPRVFAAAQAFIGEVFGADQLQCDHTRRCAPTLLAKVNDVMARAQADGDYDGFTPHTSELDAGGEVLELPRIERPARSSGAAPQACEGWRDTLERPRFEAEESLRMRESRQAARWIAQRIATGARAADIIVLSRKREGLHRLQQALRECGVAHQLREDSTLHDAPEVRDLVALLDALVSPAHTLSLAQALRSPLFGLDDAALTRIALHARAQGVGWWQVLTDAAHGLPELGAVAPALLQYRAWVEALPPHDALSLIYRHADVLARYAAALPPARRPVALANLRALLHAALELDGGRCATPYALVRALKARGVPAPESLQPDAVQLLTIHGAKGLEAGVVVLLGTDAEPRKAETMSLRVDWPPEDERPRKLVFIARESRPPRCAAELLGHERAAADREEINALYVAMTRARETLVISSTEPHQADERSWWRRLREGSPLTPVELPDDLAAQADAVIETVPAQAPIVLTALPDAPAAAMPAALAAASATTPADSRHSLSARIGEAMHRLLQWAPMPLAGWRPGASDIEAVRREFRLDAASVRQAGDMAHAILGGEAAWAWDAEALDWHGSEVELLHAGRVLRLDRLVRRRDSGAWWVLDYKSAAQPQAQPGLREQMQQYLAALRRARPGEAVIAAWISGEGRLIRV